ncbi:MarR family winged helix-turn-helix transcriptional regulator [Deinococcus radiophilus]|uniref:MarR family winged helix-turn-helix transcriptional regulator n=1 Tax=Deinococcus radiophilus TaxID=32062 RepID=UPI001E3C2C9E|nr:MarR family winged helix-turn-helix transcriptional regulator [Deinococcus radiophilus]UFA51693.1 MarR family winged helix-turn-helix transcriptional regulator [Deinococcus radiophilus]
MTEAVSPPPLTPTETDQQLFDLVRAVLRLSRRFTVAVDGPLEAELGLNIRQLLVLATVVDGQDTPSQVAESLGLTPPTVTRLISALEDQGLLERGQVPGDLRRCQLRATPAGETLRGQMRQLSRHTVLQEFGRVDTAAVSAAAASLSTLEAALDQAATRPSPGPSTTDPQSQPLQEARA